KPPTTLRPCWRVRAAATANDFRSQLRKKWSTPPRASRSTAAERLGLAAGPAWLTAKFESTRRRPGQPALSARSSVNAFLVPQTILFVITSYCLPRTMMPDPCGSCPFTLEDSGKGVVRDGKGGTEWTE